jgi:AraC-like DNA-binding protein
MKANFNQLVSSESPTFKIVEATSYHALNDFHYHDEMELTYIIEGECLLLIGDKLEQVGSGTLVMVGANVLHMFKFDTYTYRDILKKEGKTALNTKLLTLHFNPEILGDRFLAVPENNRLSTLFKEALKGLYIYDCCRETTVALMRRLMEAPNYEHLLLLMQMLTTIAVSDERAFITSPPDKEAYNKSDEKRLTKIYLYTLNNFSRVIKLKEIAGIVYMVPHAFCRYFKLRTGKSYFTFLLEIRINHACKLLKEHDYSIVVVCYESGFTNLSNFNRHFKLITGKTPLEYRKYSNA